MRAAGGGRSRLSRLFRRLLPGDVGAEVCETLERRRDERRARHGSAVAWLWHAAHLFHPQTWALAVLIRRRRNRRRGGGWGPGVSWLDVKLGLRMMTRNPGLTLVAIVTLAIGIPASLIPLHGVQALHAPLPFEEGDRIVGVRNWNVATRRTEVRSLHDFALWREESTSFEVLAAARSTAYNVLSEDGRAAPVTGSEMTASGFDIVRVPPLLGRSLLETDERPGAPDVVVVSHELWRTRLGGDPDAVGTTLYLGRRPHEVVGVMPEGFLFPWQERLWLPLRDRATDFETGSGPRLTVFGRLADGVSIEEARAELETVGARLAREYPDTHGQLRPQVMAFSELIWGPADGPEPYLAELLAVALLMIVCGNVGTLILARTASRSGEIAVRTALGASRGRIVSQLFVESLVLAVTATAVGLVLADHIAGRFQTALPLDLPFWVDFGVKPGTVGVALSVAVLCAVVAGVLPALRATRRDVDAGLRNGHRSGIRFGRAATALIVAEVALTVGFLAVGGTLTYALVVHGPATAIDTDEYLMVGLDVPWSGHGAPPAGSDSSNLRAFFGPPTPAFRQRVTEVVTGLQERLAGEPGVRGVAMGNRVPGVWHTEASVEVEGGVRADDPRGHRVHTATVDVGFFDGLGHAPLVGRGFTAGDLALTAQGHRSAVIVNTAFVEYVLGGRNPIGRQVRYAVPRDQEPGPWYQIVGVVGHLGMNVMSHRDQGVYHPAAPGEIHPLMMAVRLDGDPLAFVPRLRAIARGVDAGVLIQWPHVLSDAPNLDRTVNLYGYLLLVFVCGITLMLSGAGLYAIMSFTVTRRTREIGIRTALGARPEGIVMAVARKAFLQLLTGVVAGVALGAALLHSLRKADIPGADPAATLAACSAFMLLVGLGACVAPTRRALRIEPAEALGEG